MFSDQFTDRDASDARARPNSRKRQVQMKKKAGLCRARAFASIPRVKRLSRARATCWQQCDCGSTRARLKKNIYSARQRARVYMYVARVHPHSNCCRNHPADKLSRCKCFHRRCILTINMDSRQIYCGNGDKLACSMRLLLNSCFSIL